MAENQLKYEIKKLKNSLARNIIIMLYSLMVITADMLKLGCDKTLLYSYFSLSRYCLYQPGNFTSLLVVRENTRNALVYLQVVSCWRCCDNANMCPVTLRKIVRIVEFGI